MEALVPRKWTREKMSCAAEAGVFRPDERSELSPGRNTMAYADGHAKMVSNRKAP
jgi:prepilin-type processing-associated H-X9-DG protein